MPRLKTRTPTFSQLLKDDELLAKQDPVEMIRIFERDTNWSLSSSPSTEKGKGLRYKFRNKVPRADGKHDQFHATLDPIYTDFSRPAASSTPLNLSESNQQSVPVQPLDLPSAPLPMHCYTKQSRRSSGESGKSKWSDDVKQDGAEIEVSQQMTESPSLSAAISKSQKISTTNNTKSKPEVSVSAPGVRLQQSTPAKISGSQNNPTEKVSSTAANKISPELFSEAANETLQRTLTAVIQGDSIKIAQMSNALGTISADFGLKVVTNHIHDAHR